MGEGLWATRDGSHRGRGGPGLAAGPGPALECLHGNSGQLGGGPPHHATCRAGAAGPCGARPAAAVALRADGAVGRRCRMAGLHGRSQSQAIRGPDLTRSAAFQSAPATLVIRGDWLAFAGNPVALERANYRHANPFYP